MRDVESRIDKQATATRQTIIWVSFDTALARMNRPRPAMTCLRAGGSYSYSVALRIIDCNNSDAQPLVFVELGALSTATCLRRRRFSAADVIFRGRLLLLHPPHISHPALPATIPMKPAK